jgi:predicted lysophospholipase L1 biosynthesis ABC-type transport system permease subunit
MYTKYATRSLVRGGQRTVFAVFCIAFGVLVIVALQLVGNAVAASLTGNIRAINGGDIAVHTEYHDLRTWQLSYFDQLKAQGAITAYTASISSDATTPTARGTQRFGFETVDPATFPIAGALHFIAPADGSLAALLHGHTVVVTDKLVQYLGVHLGDTLAITTEEGRAGTVIVGGIVANTGFFIGRPDMLIAQQTYDALSNLSSAPDGYTWVWVNVPGHDDPAAASLAAEMQRHFPLVTAITVQQEQQALQDELQGIRSFLQVIGLLALLIGGVGIVNTMQVLLRRRQLEIAMLKTTGYRRFDLMLMFGLEAALLGLAGGAIGAAAGVGMRFLVASLVERAFFLTLPASVDLLTVASGVLIGVATTLIFGLLPIVQTSAIRPLAVLRETAEPGGWRRALSSAGLIGLLGALFYLLALAILRNPLIAAAAVGGAGLLLFLLTFAFAGLAWLISRLPVLDGLRWWYALLVGLALLAGVGVLRWAPTFAVLLLALGLGAAVVVALPRTAKADVRLALRNIGRARIRSATTLVALFSGVFAVGLGMSLGQGLKDSLTQQADVHARDNAYVLASSQDAPGVAQQLARAPGLTHEQVTLAAPAQIVAVNGVPLSRILATATPSGSAGSVGAIGTSVSGVEGFDLAAGDLPTIVLEPGSQDGRTGRNLIAADAGTTNALVPLNDSQPPLSLKLGATLAVSGLDQPTATTLHVVGFYTSVGFDMLAPVLVDKSVVNRLSDRGAYYIYALHLDPVTADRTLQQIKQAVPGAVTLSVGATLAQIYALLDNVINLIESVASLALLAGIIMIANAVALAMLERRREMGILKAVGHTSRGVLGTVLLENAVLGVAGAFLAMLLVTLATTLLGRVIFRFWSSAGIAPPLVLGLVAATGAVCVLVAGGVAWSATRVRPLEVLRYE